VRAIQIGTPITICFATAGYGDPGPTLNHALSRILLDRTLGALGPSGPNTTSPLCNLYVVHQHGL
jgi:hypothetical protein